MIHLDADTLNRLHRLLATKKFLEEDYYPGAPTEEIRSACERRVNDFLGDVIALLQKGTDREQILARTRALGETFEEEDTEEREKVDDYIGEAMRIIGIDDWTEHL